MFSVQKGALTLLLVYKCWCMYWKQACGRSLWSSSVWSNLIAPNHLPFGLWCWPLLIPAPAHLIHGYTWSGASEHKQISLGTWPRSCSNCKNGPSPTSHLSLLSSRSITSPLFPRSQNLSLVVSPQLDCKKFRGWDAESSCMLFRERCNHACWIADWSV